MRSSGTTVELEPDRVVKRQDAARARAELDRTMWGARVGMDTGAFRVPAVVSHDPGRGEIVFERLADMRPLAEILRAGDATDALVARVGRILAAIHERDRDASSVSIHGDFASGNVLYDATRDELAVIDWSNGHWLGLDAQTRRASPCLDLATFLLSIFYRRAFAGYGIPELAARARAFLSAYCAARPDFRVDRLGAELPGILKRWESSQLAQRGCVRRILYHPSILELRRFVARFEPDPARSPT